MDYFLSEIQEKIDLYEGEEQSKVYLQIRIEYCIFLMLSYLWNKNFSKNLSVNKRNALVKSINRPTLGSVINVLQTIDLEKEFINETHENLFNYVKYRNVNIGHGYVLSDGLDEYLKNLESFYNEILSANLPIINEDLQLVVVESFNEENNIYIGKSYHSNKHIVRWKCSGKVYNFKIGNVYGSFSLNNYFRLSPYIHIEDYKKLYVFREITNIGLGTVAYSRIDETQTDYIKDWKELSTELSYNDGIRKVAPNGTIMNDFVKNYSTYIDVGLVKEKILEYIIGSKRHSYVSITIWGHGGVGKTATAQKICEDLGNDISLNSRFEYIVFLSAKNRLLRPETLEIESIEEGHISTYSQFIKKLNEIVINQNIEEIEPLLSLKKRILLVVDDFETFPDEEKEKIVEFTEHLNVSLHKVIFTTRNKFLEIGKGISSSELNSDDTLEFLMKVLEKYYNYNNSAIKNITDSIIKNNLKEKVLSITSGRPLFIFAFANYISQSGGDIVTLLNSGKIKEIGSQANAVEFLYGKVYEQLKNDRLSQEIFSVIGLITPKHKLSSLLSHVKYVLNRRFIVDEEFDNSLKKLIDLRILVVDDKFYKVYSEEILNIMLLKYNENNINFKRDCNSRYQSIEKSIDKETGQALLENANYARTSSFSPQYVIDKYQELLNIESISTQIKLQALFNLTEYLYNLRDLKDLAVKKIEENKEYLVNFELTRRYSEYCWSLGDDTSREKCIDSLKLFLLWAKSEEKKIILTDNQRLRLLSLIVLRSSLYWASREDRGEKDVIKEYKIIYDKYGHLLIQGVKRVDISTYDSGERQDILTSIPNLIDAMVKIKGTV